jgi:hypothetical protein
MSLEIFSFKMFKEPDLKDLTSEANTYFLPYFSTQSTSMTTLGWEIFDVTEGLASYLHENGQHA